MKITFNSNIMTVQRYINFVNNILECVIMNFYVNHSSNRLLENFCEFLFVTDCTIKNIICTFGLFLLNCNCTESNNKEWFKISVS